MQTNDAQIVVELPADERIWLISDLHLGDGTSSDVFFGKDRHLIALIKRVEQEGAFLVVNGDVVDFHQAWSFMRIVRAHQELLSAMSRLAREGRLIYVIGNHDYDLNVFKSLLNFRVCTEIHIGDQALVCHGYRFDPVISTRIGKSHWSTKAHHAIERLCNTWLRIPFGEFYTLPNRIAVWLGHKVGVMLKISQALKSSLGVSSHKARFLTGLDYWAWSNQGDSMCIFRPAMEHLKSGPWNTIICGHSHLPGVVRHGTRVYANTGSWTFASSQYLIWDRGEITCRDWITGREFLDHLYRPLIDGSIYERGFFQWWRENYMGWLRFREGEERHGQLRRWESYLRDYQYLAQLRPLPEQPVSTEDSSEDPTTPHVSQDSHPLEQP